MSTGIAKEYCRIYYEVIKKGDIFGKFDSMEVGRTRFDRYLKGCGE